MKKTIKYKVAAEGRVYKDSFTIPGGHLTRDFLVDSNNEISNNIAAFIIETLLEGTNG